MMDVDRLSRCSEKFIREEILRLQIELKRAERALEVKLERDAGSSRPTLEED